MAESALVGLGTPSRLLEMALVYWTRSANQGDVDSRVKMGDYYFHGIGTEADFKKATACYQVAGNAEYSAMAMWNLGWMHENGVGVAKVTFDNYGALFFIYCVISQLVLVVVTQSIFPLSCCSNIY